MLIQKILHLALKIPSKRKAERIHLGYRKLIFIKLNLHTMLDRIPFHILHDRGSSQQKLVRLPHPLIMDITTLKRQRPSSLCPAIPVEKPIAFYLPRVPLLIRHLAVPFLLFVDPYYLPLILSSLLWFSYLQLSFCYSPGFVCHYVMALSMFKFLPIKAAEQWALQRKLTCSLLV